MLRFTQLIEDRAEPRPSNDASDAVLTMRFEDRRRSRMRARLDDGREAALLLPRGTVLRDGDRLRDPDANEVVTVRAAAQTLSLARASDGLLLTRAAYHLGNRHIPVQVGPGWLAYEHDHGGRPVAGGRHTRRAVRARGGRLPPWGQSHRRASP